MRDDLKSFLESATRLSETSVTWGVSHSLRVSYYSGRLTPPLHYVSSARAIVFRDDSVLVVREPSGHLYILPGGRLKECEDPVDALRREILEETGWTVFEPSLIGFMHLHHLTEKPPNYEYPHPDFLWPVYEVEADHWIPGAKIPDEYVSASGFRPVEVVRKLPIDRGELRLLEAALTSR